MKNNYSDELKQWLIENYKGTSEEVLARLKKEFNINISRKKLYSLVAHLQSKGYKIGKLEQQGFKKGNNWKILHQNAIGTIRRRKDGNYIKLKNGKWYEYYKYVYERKYGKGKKGFVIHHINGDLFDDRIENLARLSLPIHNYLIGRQLWFNDRENFFTACLLAELAHIKPHYIRPSRRKGEINGTKLLI